MTYKLFMNKKILMVSAGVVVVGMVSVLFIWRTNDIPYTLAMVKKGTLVQEVSVSGKVESPTQIDLRFRNSGKLVATNVKVGGDVVAGQLLSKQDTAQLDAQVLEMQAGIDLQKAKLNQLLSGASSEDVAVSETAIWTAERSLDDAKKNLFDKLRNAYTKSDDAIRGKSDQLFSNPKTPNPELLVIPSSSQLEIDVERERVLIESTLLVWGKSLDTISSQSDLLPAIILAHTNTTQIRSFLDQISLIVNALAPSSNFTQTTIDKWKTDISTARTNVDTAVSNLYTAEENLKTKEAGLKTAIDQLALKKAPVRSSDIAVYQAQISQAEALLQKTQAQRADLMLFAPSSGTVTEVRGELGETIGPDITVVSMSSGGALQVKVDIVEDKIINVQVGQDVRISFDAIPNEEFGGKVVVINPAETIVGGAVYYQATILLNKVDDRIRSGMTANVWIETAVSENTLFIPASALQDRDGKKIVQVFDNGQIVEKEIIISIKDDTGMVEVISGLYEGEQIILGNKK